MQKRRPILLARFGQLRVDERVKITPLGEMTLAKVAFADEAEFLSNADRSSVLRVHMRLGPVKAEFAPPEIEQAGESFPGDPLGSVSRLDPVKDFGSMMIVVPSHEPREPDDGRVSAKPGVPREGAGSWRASISLTRL